MTRPDEKHPVVVGLIALASVAVVVGLIVGVIAISATHVLGIGRKTTAGGVAEGASLYLPTPSPTRSATGALITLTPAPGASSQSAPGVTTSTPGAPTSTKAARTKINLTASVTSASPMAQFDLSGTYPGGEGHILRVQRKSPGSDWEDFGVPDMDVQGGLFDTPVETGRTGQNQFRVKDVDNGKVSNAVTVQIG